MAPAVTVRRCYSTIVELHRGINFSRLEVPADAGGLIFVAGSVLALLIGVPAFRWFLVGATLVGTVVAVALLEWHRAHPEPPARERSISLDVFDRTGRSDDAHPAGRMPRG